MLLSCFREKMPAVEPQDGREGIRWRSRQKTEGEQKERRARVHFPVEECSYFRHEDWHFAEGVAEQKSKSDGTFWVGRTECCELASKLRIGWHLIKGHDHTTFILCLPNTMFDFITNCHQFLQFWHKEQLNMFFGIKAAHKCTPTEENKSILKSRKPPPHAVLISPLTPHPLKPQLASFSSGFFAALTAFHSDK